MIFNVIMYITAVTKTYVKCDSRSMKFEHALTPSTLTSSVMTSFSDSIENMHTSLHCESF